MTAPTRMLTSTPSPSRIRKVIPEARAWLSSLWTRRRTPPEALMAARRRTEGFYSTCRCFLSGPHAALKNSGRVYACWGISTTEARLGVFSSSAGAAAVSHFVILPLVSGIVGGRDAGGDRAAASRRELQCDVSTHFLAGAFTTLSFRG